ncbi:MAG: hypothetical protein ACI8XB_003005 [Patiriisocius sp.]|jgi:uncharacterized protein (TIRG00374 family)
MDEKKIKQKLGMKRVFIPVFIGLIAAGYVLYKSLTEVRFDKTEPGKGDYILKDNSVEHDIADADHFILMENGDFTKSTVKQSLKKVDWGFYSIVFLLAAIVFLVMRVTGYIMRIRILSEKKLSWRQCFDVVLLWEFASALTPSVVGGAGVAIFFLGREKISLGKSTAIVMITAMLDELFYVLVVPFTFFFVIKKNIFPESWQQEIFGFNLTAEGVFWVGYFFIFILIFTLVYAVFINPRGFRFLLLRIFNIQFLKKWQYKVIQWGNDLVLASKEYRSKPLSFWLSTFGWTFFSWTSRFLLLNCLIMIVVPSIDHVYVYAKQLGMWVIMLISPTPGGSGLAEVAFYHFFGDSVVPLTLVGLLAILWRLLTYFPYIFVGVLVLPGWLKRTSSGNSNG